MTSHVSALKVTTGMLPLTLSGVNYPLTVWNGSEVFIIIICGSMPALKVLWDRYVKKTRQAPSKKNEYIEMMGSSRDETTLRTASPSTLAKGDGQASQIIATTRIEIKRGMVTEPCDTNYTDSPRTIGDESPAILPVA